jgi:hypothetical protein
MTLKGKKVDELKIKNDNLNDTLRQMKNRYNLLVEKVKKHSENNCKRGEELLRVINKLDEL